MNEKFYEQKKIKSNGARYHLIRFQGDENWKLHRWEGPAIEPLTKACLLKPEYYINGISYSKFEFENAKRDKDGLPWYKNPSMRGVTRF